MIDRASYAAYYSTLNDYIVETSLRKYASTAIDAFGIVNRKHSFALLPRKSFGIFRQLTSFYYMHVISSAFDINISRANQAARSTLDSKTELAELMHIFAPKLNS